MDELDYAMPRWLNNWLNDWAPWRLREMMQIQESAIANLEAQNQRLLEAASRSARAADSRNAQLAQVSAERDAARNERDQALGRIQKMLLTIANLENDNCDVEKARDLAVAELNRLQAIIDRFPGTLGSLRSALLCECSRLSAAVDTGITQALDALK